MKKSNSLGTSFNIFENEKKKKFCFFRRNMKSNETWKIKKHTATNKNKPENT